MISAILSLVLGLLSLGTVPVVIPVIGLALGFNALIKERKNEAKKKSVIVISIIGIIINGIIAILFLLTGFIK